MYVLFDNEIDEGSNTSVGGKALALARLLSADLPVPNFFVVAPTAMQHHIATDAALLSLLEREDGSGAEKVGDAICSIGLDGEVLAEIEDAIARLLTDTPGSTELIAVRSSAAQEDSTDASFAGQFTSFLGVRPSSVEAAIKRCWASYFSPRAARYRAVKLEVQPGWDFAVIVQRQLLPEKAGVLFTRHPLFPDDATQCLIEANFGSGESVVAGIMTPDSYTCRWPTGEVLQERVSAKHRMSVVEPAGGSEVVDVPGEKRDVPVLSAGDLTELVAVARKIEDLFEAPQDIEWAIVSEQIWIVQSRPITQLQTRVPPG